jgi:hypothetical protein
MTNILPSFLPGDFSGYVVTGREVRGKRFRVKVASVMYAFGFNLWNGSVWGIRKDNGKRKLLKRVNN